MFNKSSIRRPFFSNTLRLALGAFLFLTEASSIVQAKSLEGRLNNPTEGIFPNDTYFLPYQWALNDLWPARLNVPAAWSITTGTPDIGSPDIVVAVIDTGLDQYHPDLASKITGAGYNFVDDSFDIQDSSGHGTSVAGIIAADSNNNIGVAGMSWGAKILPIKVLSPNGNQPSNYVCVDEKIDWLIEGIKYAADNHADIINLSWICHPTDSKQITRMQEAVDYAYNMGVVIVAGAGNSNEDLDEILTPIPAGLNHVIAVGATNIYDERCDIYTCKFETGHGSRLDVMAPGSGIATTVLGNDNNAYTLGGFHGTSASAPFVSGLAALMLSVNPNLRGDPDQVEYIIQHTVVDLGISGFDTLFGYGRINAYQAVYRAMACGQGSWPGDANRDCRVDGIDYVVWLSHAGQPTANGPSDGDFNYSGMVDQADLQIWLENYDK